MKARRKKTGEKEMFLEIWSERPHKSEVSGKPLIEDTNNPFWYSQFSHLLPKKNYGRYRLLKENIVLKTWDEHDQWTRFKSSLENKPEWKWVFEKEEELRIRYFASR